ncbi:MAG TPA: carboxymuconolactone decarboxylase family protein [Ktedonobacteraceae bacterium]
MARIPYPGPSYVSGVMHQLPERLQRTNIGRMLSYAPTTLTPYYTFSAALLDQLELEPNLRELTILRVAHLTEVQYAWTQHVVLAQLAGVSDEQITALQLGETGGAHFTTKEQLAMAFAGEVMRTPRLSDALFEHMRSHFSSREIVELLLVVGWYWTVGRLMTTLDIEPDAALGTRALQMLREHNGRFQPST